MNRKPEAAVSHPFFECRDGIYEIDEFDCDDIFVVVGSERALVIDTGTGIGDLQWVIENKITDKPYDIVATHSDLDHIGGAAFFDKPIHIHEADVELAELTWDMVQKEQAGETFTKEDEDLLRPTYALRKWYMEIIRGRTGFHYAYDPEKDLRVWKKRPTFIPVKDGHVFDLGDRKVTVYHCPGHTKGEIVLIDSKTRTLLSGDAINCNWYLNSDLAATPKEAMEISAKALLRIEAMAGKEFDENSVFNFHHDYRGFGQELDPATVHNLARCMESIVNGTANYVVERDPMRNDGGTRKVARVGNATVGSFGNDLEEIFK